MVAKESRPARTGQSSRAVPARRMMADRQAARLLAAVAAAVAEVVLVVVRP